MEKTRPFLKTYHCIAISDLTLRSAKTTGLNFSPVRLNSESAVPRKVRLIFFLCRPILNPEHMINYFC